MIARRVAGCGTVLLLLFQLPASSAGPSSDPERQPQRAIGAGRTSGPSSRLGSHAFARPARAALSQEAERKPLGALNTVGEVYVNDARAPSDGTIFPGNTLRTGSDASATFTVSGQGSLKIGPKTRVAFVAEPAYLAELQEGSLVLSAFAGAPNFKVRTGNFVVVPGPEAIAEMDRSADGSFHVACTAGSVGLIEFEGTEAAFLGPGQSMIISADGKLRPVTGALTATTSGPGAAPSPTGTKKSHNKLIAAGVGGGGAAVLIGVLASRGKSSVSPSSR